MAAYFIKGKVAYHGIGRLSEVLTCENQHLLLLWNLFEDVRGYITRKLIRLELQGMVCQSQENKISARSDSPSME